MKAEIISIGTEILMGSILNTNSQYLAQVLAREAIDVEHIHTVGDNPGRIRESMLLALSRADIVLCSGGLGPTEDDITLQVASQLTQQALIENVQVRKQITDRLKKRRIPVTPRILRQCFVPKNSKVLLNQNGTAPGVIMPISDSAQTRHLILLPGPPGELEPMFENQVLPFLIRQFGSKKDFFEIRSIRITGLVEAQVADKVSDLLRLSPPLTVGIYAKRGETELKIMSKFPSKKKAMHEANQIERTIRKRLGKNVYGGSQDTLASVAGEYLLKNRLTLSVAESCTGGLISHQITDIPGSSRYFLGGIVAYSNAVKISHLDISEALIKSHGAVSQAVALDMAKKIRVKLKSDVGLSVTGIAGPGGASPTKPVGLVYIALATATRAICYKHAFSGSRNQIKSRTALQALDHLRRWLS